MEIEYVDDDDEYNDDNSNVNQGEERLNKIENMEPNRNEVEEAMGKVRIEEDKIVQL